MCDGSPDLDCVALAAHRALYNTVMYRLLYRLYDIDQDSHETRDRGQMGKGRTHGSRRNTHAPYSRDDMQCDESLMAANPGRHGTASARQRVPLLTGTAAAHGRR